MTGGQGHSVECCPPDTCDWCGEPIEPGQSWTRKTTTYYGQDHAAIKEWWSDYHHDPLSYEALNRGVSRRRIDPTAGPVGTGACLWHSEQ